MIKGDSDMLASDFVIEVLAGEALSARDAVYISSADGKAYKCDADDTTKTEFIGFAQEATSLGATVQIRNHGLMTGFSGLTTGSKYYLSSTAGAISTTQTSVKVGVAVSATVIKIAEVADVQVFTSNDTWVKPTRATFARVVCIGGGGSGGGGYQGAVAQRGGGTGGGGGAVVEKIFRISDLSSTVSITVGAQVSGGTQNNNGNAGNSSSFGSYLTAYGGGAGASGGNALKSGGGGGGSGGAGGAGSSTTVTGGVPASAVNLDGISGQGAGTTTDADGKCAEFGGGAGGGSNTGGTTAKKGGSSLFGGAGGGAGGGIDAGTGEGAGGAGGAHGSYTAGGGGSGGAATGAAGTAGTARSGFGCGDGGGGGGGLNPGAGGAGGDGGLPGGGGGGGGAGTTAGGTGGVGARGEVRVYVW